MKIVIAGLGITISRSFRGSEACLDAPPIEWQWCLAVHYRTPWTRLGGWSNWYAVKYFYLEPSRSDHAPGYWEWVYKTRLWRMYGHESFTR
jgi:hypothetical protein